MTVEFDDPLQIFVTLVLFKEVSLKLNSTQPTILISNKFRRRPQVSQDDFPMRLVTHNIKVLLLTRNRLDHFLQEFRAPPFPPLLQHLQVGARVHTVFDFGFDYVELEACHGVDLADFFG